MAFARNAGFTSAIATDPADTAAGYLTPTRYNLPFVVSGADVGGIPYCPTATTEVTSANLTWAAATGQGLVMAAGTATTDVNALNITQTMNAAAVAFTGSKWTFTEGASGTAAGTLLFNILYGTSGAEASKFSVNKAGVINGPASVVYFQGTTLANCPVAINYLGLSIASGVWVQWGNDVFAPSTPDVNLYRIGNGSLGLGAGASTPGGSLSLTNLILGSNADTNLSRISAGIIGVGTGAAASFAGSLKLTTLTLDGLAITKGYTVAGLPAGVTGAIAHVTDQLTAAAAKGVAPTGGGAVNCVVYYNGAAWVGI